MAKAKALTRTAATGPSTTTIRVRSSTKRIVEEMVKAQGSTYDEVIARMARHERQRIIGADLAQRELSPADEAVIRSGSDTVARASR
jgi:hypothetical protein